VLDPFEILSSLKARSGVVFPVLHGPLGEDGAIQGLLETAGVAYVGCGVLASALGMDKEATKRLCALAKIPILEYRAARNPAQARAAAKVLGYPLFVKPARLGSSVGVARVDRPSQLAKAIAGAFRYDDKILLEKGIPAREVECALLGDPWSAQPGDPLALKVTDCGEIIPKNGFYDYRAKYLDPEGARLKIPAPLSALESSQIKKTALAAFAALDGYGMARADFLLDKKTGRVYFNEINTIPGFTASSMYPLLWKREGLATRALVTRLIELALRRWRRGLKLKIKP
jgi:D-alanine-D-alanine ligase